MESKQHSAETLKKYFLGKEKLFVLGILTAIFFIRFYYFILTKTQPLWWDESDYMAAAKDFAGIGDYKLESIRLPIFSFIVSLLFRLSFGEPLIRFVILFIPSIVVIFSLYILVSEMYKDRRVAMISIVLFGVLWEHVFYSNRFHTENFSLIFQLFAMIFLVKSYLKKEKIFLINPKYSLIPVVICILISVLFRPGSLIFIPGLFLFFIFLQGKFLFKDLRNTSYTILFLIFVFLSFMISINLIEIPIVSNYFAPERPISFVYLEVFEGFFKPSNLYLPNIIHYFFLLGLGIFLAKAIFSYEFFKKLSPDKEDLHFKSDLLNLFIIMSCLVSFIFFLRTGSYEFRWFFPLITGLFSFTAKGIISFADFIGKNTSVKNISSIIIIFLSLFASYTQLVHAEAITKEKLDSYSQVKYSGIWMRDNSAQDEIIISASVPQHSYYSERKVYNFHFSNENLSEEYFNEKIKEVKPKYVVVSVFEPGFTPSWAYDWPQRNNETLKPVKVYFSDSQNNQPVLVVYEFSSNTTI